MAEVIRLSIEYSTAGALAQIQALERKLAQLEGVQVKTKRGAAGLTAATTASAGAMRGATLGAVKLADALSTGNLSAAAFVGSVTKLASVLSGVVTLGLLTVITTMALLVTAQRRASEHAKKLSDQLRDTVRRVNDLMNPGEATPFVTEIRRIQDAIADLDREMAKQKGNIFERLFGSMMNPKKFLEGIGRFLFGGVNPETAAARRGLAGQLNQIDPVRAEQNRFTRELGIAGQLNAARGGGRLGAMHENVRLLNEQLENFAEIGKSADDAFSQTAKALAEATANTRRFERQLRLMEDGLLTIADTIEEFVTRGTLAFSEFLDNIFRLLYRDFTGQFIEGLVSSAAAGKPGQGVVTVGKVVPATIGNKLDAAMSPSVQSHVTFNVQALDAQGVAQFLEREGGNIAATVTRHAARSKAMRTAFAR